VNNEKAKEIFGEWKEPKPYIRDEPRAVGHDLSDDAWRRPPTLGA
jgi:hypothetical protein